MQAIQITNEQKIIASVSQLCEAASSVVILSREDLSEATDIVKAIKTRAKAIEDERTSLVKPFNDGVKQINAKFKQMSEPLEEAQRDVKGKMPVFQQDENRKADELRKQAEAAAAEQAAQFALENKGPPNTPPPVIHVAPPKTTHGQLGGTSTLKKVWSYELVNISEVAAARPDLIVLDAAKVTAEIRAGARSVPGLHIFEREIVSVR